LAIAEPTIPMQPDERRQSSVRYWESSWFSYLTFGWVNTLVDTGLQRQVTLEDTPELAQEEDALVNTRALLENLDESERARKSHPLLRSLWYTFWPQFLILQFLRVGAHFLGLLDPILMGRVLVFQERQNASQDMTGDEVRTGFECVSGLILLGFFMLFFNTQMQFYQNRLLVRISSALRGAVLFRCIQGQRGVGDNSISGPSAYNVISFDIDPVVDIIWIVLALWLFPIQFISTLYVLFQHVGMAVVPGVVVIVLAKLICGFLLYRDGVLRHILLEAKDTRLRNCNEGFNHIRTLHMLAWRAPFQEQIMESRKHELHAQKMRLWMTKMVAALDYSLSMIVTFATLGYFVFKMNGQLTASVALPVIQLIVNLMGPIGQFPIWMNQYMVWKSAYGRLSAFIGLQNNPSPNAEEDELFDTRGGGGPPPDFRNKVAALKDCTLCWGVPPKVTEGSMEQGRPLLDPDAFELKNLDVGVKGGELLVVVGLEGQGKSSMLLGLLGEMTVKSGKAHSPAITRHTASSAGGASLPGLPKSSKIARQLASEEKTFSDCAVNPLAVPFSEQSAMLFTGSIRWNITFGAPYQPHVYMKVVKACALEEDLATMPAGDLTEVAQAGATLSGGQKRRISIARTVYRAAVQLEQQPTITPLVLLDDPVCSLDKKVAQEVSEGLFGEGGLLASCAVVVATADPWWVGCLQSADAVVSSQEAGLRVALVRSGSIIDMGSPSEMHGKGFAELDGIIAKPVQPAQPPVMMSNPQGDEDDEMPTEENEDSALSESRTDLDGRLSLSPATGAPKVVKKADCETQTELTEAQKEAMTVVKEEECDEGCVKWSTYQAYMHAVGTTKLVTCAIALTCIMVFQNLCNLWITYWTSDTKENSFVYTSLRTVHITPPEEPHQLLYIFGGLVCLFTMSNFAGHSLEIIGGVAAAGSIFKKALVGTFHQPFRWWDANPTGRVLNRFSEDVMVMDAAITNIMGVLFGAVLYFFGHAIVLAIANPWSLLLLPPIAAGLEYYAQYYRKTIREVHRIFRVRMGLLYQDMLEAIVGRVTVRSFAQENRVMETSIDNLDRYQQVAFCKTSLALWLGLRMAMIGYVLSFWVKLRPILQYYGCVGEQSAALVGFSIMYSTETIAIIQQFITNYSDLEMQLISIERLCAVAEQERLRITAEQNLPLRDGLQLSNVTVTYRSGLLPALAGVNLAFSPEEIAAIVGRTGAGKSSLLLSILQLVPYEGRITINKETLHNLDSDDVRRRLVGVVPQQPVLFEGDLRWNLDPDNERSDDDLWTALAAVGLEAKCRAAGGLSSKVPGTSSDSKSSGNDGVTVDFSAGQQQMLCAARVLLRRPKVAMLDEVAASLPSEAAVNMVSTLMGRFKEHNSTVLMVTHQDNLLALCDRIIRVDGGRVVGDERT
jgi:ABC-type multidrug transport system fused ATPase/permease subunit